MISKIALLLVCHFVGDFILQSRSVGTGKHRDRHILYYHCAVYTLPFAIIVRGLDALVFIMYSHCLVDYVTSKITKRYYEQKRMYAFWTVIGADQMLHVMSLLAVIWMWQLA